MFYRIAVAWQHLLILIKWEKSVSPYFMMMISGIELGFLKGDCELFLFSYEGLWAYFEYYHMVYCVWYFDPTSDQALFTYELSLNFDMRVDGVTIWKKSDRLTGLGPRPRPRPTEQPSTAGSARHGSEAHDSYTRDVCNSPLPTRLIRLSKPISSTCIQGIICTQKRFFNENWELLSLACFQIHFRSSRFLSPKKKKWHEHWQHSMKETRKGIKRYAKTLSTNILVWIKIKNQSTKWNSTWICTCSSYTLD